MVHLVSKNVMRVHWRYKCCLSKTIELNVADASISGGKRWKTILLALCFIWFINEMEVWTLLIVCKPIFSVPLWNWNVGNFDSAQNVPMPKCEIVFVEVSKRGLSTDNHWFTTVWTGNETNFDSNTHTTSSFSSKHTNRMSLFRFLCDLKRFQFQFNFLLALKYRNSFFFSYVSVLNAKCELC